MGNKIEKKKEIVCEIEEKIKNAVGILLIDSCGLTADISTQLRKELREAGVVFKVYKNTMLKLAFKNLNLDGLIDFLAGPSAIAISYNDATSAARIINKFMKENECLKFKAGIFDGDLYSGEKVKEIANIPSREELLSKLLGSLKSPISGFARVIKALAEKKAA